MKTINVSAAGLTAVEIEHDFEIGFPMSERSTARLIWLSFSWGIMLLVPYDFVSQTLNPKAEVLW